MNKGTFSTNKPLLIIADADSIVAQAYADDTNHKQVLSLSRMLAEKGAHILFPSTAISEAVTTLQRKFSDPHLAASTLNLLTEPDIDIESIDEEIIRKAKKLFDPNASKHNTFFDCIVATVAKKHNADAVFSFDDWYSKLGFKLVSDLFSQYSNYQA